MNQRSITFLVAVFALVCGLDSPGADAQTQKPAAASPASKPPPATVTPQSYPPEQVQAGQTRFAGQCGFCHGRDAAGGEGGPDLIRSALVAEDVRGRQDQPGDSPGASRQGDAGFESERFRILPPSSRSSTTRRRKPRHWAEAAVRWTSRICRPETSRPAGSISTARADARSAIR